MQSRDVPIWDFSSQRPTRRRRSAKRVTVALVLMILVVGLTAAHILLTQHAELDPATLKKGPSAQQRALREMEGQAPARMSRRLNFPYSVIAGGVCTSSELRGAVARDPGLAAHYSEFDLQRVRFVTLRQDMWAYVSYRLPEGIYWTTKRAHLRRGEALVTDETHMARGRCGNRISMVPRIPVLARGPEPEEMEIPGELIPPPFEPGSVQFEPGVRREPTTPVEVVPVVPVGPVVPVVPVFPPAPHHPRVSGGGPISEGPIVFLGIVLALWRFRERNARKRAGQNGPDASSI